MIEQSVTASNFMLNAVKKVENSKVSRAAAISYSSHSVIINTNLLK